MAEEKDEDAKIYHLTAINEKGKPVSSWNETTDCWSSTNDLSQDSFLDREHLFVALDAAAENSYKNVKVRRVSIGDELSGDEIRTLRREEVAAQRQREREDLIEDKDLTPEQVALIAQQ